jgi:predicted esterase
MNYVRYVVGALIGAVVVGFVGDAVAQQVVPNEVFSVEDLISGTSSTKERCASTESALWIEVEGRGDCIRYYAGGLKDRNNAAIIYFHGARLFGPADPFRAGADQAAQKKLIEIVRAGYPDNTAAAQTEQVRWIQSGLDVPFIKIARPGVYGSSGDHKVRIHMREELLMTTAVEALAKRYAIENMAVIGNSEGGNIAAFALSRLPNLKCVVLTSSALSLETILKVDSTSGYNSSPGVYDPIKNVSIIPRSEYRRIFVVGDPADQISPISNQREYFDALIAAGHAAWYATTPTAAGGSHHTLDRTGMHIAKWCLDDVASEEILRRIAAGALRG